MTTVTDAPAVRADNGLPAVAEPIEVEALRRQQRAFLNAFDPVRPELHAYCRRLTGDLWDAEDLVQETLARALGRAASSHAPIERPIAWLVRIATNAYLDGRRRPEPVPVEVRDRPADTVADPVEVRDALAEVAMLLPPQERAAFVLKEVFDLPLAEIAAMLTTSVGAVKAALHRGRGRLSDEGRSYADAMRQPPDRLVVDALAAAFTAYDLDRLTALFLADGVSDVVGMVYETGRDQAAAGSLRHTLVVEDDVRYRAEVVELDGEPIVVLWSRPVDSSAEEAVADVLRVGTADGGVARLRWYFFCPETLREVTDRLGLPCRPVGYHF
jgi:RNA polymerase sigma-70 factor (ECF subfamily)